VHVILVWTLVHTWGITGAAVAWTIRVSFDACLVCWAAFRLSGTSPRSVLNARLVRTLATLVALAGGTTAIAARATPVWIEITLLIALVAATAVFAWRYLLDEPDRARVRNLHLGIQGSGPR
jgi:hypothetical protein